MKEFSVVVTTYMNERYIGPAIESVLGQTFGDYEMIVVDDGSTDNTKEAVSKYRDERIKYVWQEHSGLPASARNRGVELATGRFIAFLDGDNIWYPRKLEKCLEAFNNDPTIDIICHELDLLRANDEKVFRRTFYGPYYKEDMYSQLLIEGNCLDPSSTVMKRDIFSKDRFSFSEERELFTVEDYDFWMRLAESKRYRFFSLPEILAAHRVFDESSTLKYIDKHALNTLFLLDRNFNKFGTGDRRLKRIIKRRKSQVMFGAALAFNYRGKFLDSLVWHIKTIREYPLYWKPYVSFFPTLFRVRLKYL